MIEVELPDGTIAEFPDDMSTEAIQSVLQGQFGSANNAAPSSGQTAPNLDDYYSSGIYAGEYNPLGPIARSLDAAATGVGQGLTFGFGDNLAGPNETARQAQLAESNPVASTVGNVAGGMMLPASGVTAVGRVAPNAAGIGGLLARTGVSGLEGAGVGALTAAGNDQDVATGALLGGGLGVGGNLIGEGAQAVASALRTPQSRGAEYVQRAAQSEGLTPDIAQQRLAGLGPDAVLADVSPTLRSQARGAYAQPGESQAIIADSLSNRGTGAGQRIESAADASLGQGQNLVQTADDIIAARSAAAKPLYDTARPTPVKIGSETAELLERPAVKAAIERAKVSAANRGEVFDTSEMTVGNIDAIKRELDDAIGVAKRSGENGTVATLTGVKNRLVEVADEASPEYAQARRAFQGPTQVLDAMEDGQNVFANSMKPDALRKHLESLDDASREAYVQGARQNVADIMGTARSDSQGARSAFSKGYNREKLEILVGKDQADAMIKAIDAENAYQGTKNVVMGGSSTVPSANAQSLVAGGNNDDSIIKNILNFNYGTAIGQGVDSLIGGARASRNANTNAEIARILMSRDPSALLAQANPDVRSAVAQMLISGSNAATGN